MQDLKQGRVVGVNGNMLTVAFPALKHVHTAKIVVQVLKN